MMKKSNQQYMLNGAKDMLPILLGVVPFAMITGVAAVNVGLSVFESIGMSVIVFAGASQLAVLQLMNDGALWVVMVLTAWVINLRFSMYSATLAPYFAKLPTRTKALFAYILSDQAFAITISRFYKGEDVQHAWYYFGAAGFMWLAWQASVVLGALLGAQIPKSWGLEFTFPLTFMALMFAAMRNRSTVLAALVGGSVAILAKPLPYNLGLVFAATAGITAGVVSERFIRKEPE